ncbi:MAG: hypothetical protein H8E44_02030 [Planctomycetes bacterium]|nr:hypothetical protein [Planctomycetota bacterium]
MSIGTIRIAVSGIFATLLAAGSVAAQMRVVDELPDLLGAGNLTGRHSGHVRSGGNASGGRTASNSVSNGNAFAVSGGSSQPKSITDWYDMDWRRRANSTKENIDRTDRSIRDLLQRRRHALYTYQHGGGYQQDAQNYHRLTAEIQKLQDFRYRAARSFHVQNINALQYVMSQTQNPAIRNQCQARINDSRARIQNEYNHLRQTWLSN